MLASRRDSRPGFKFPKFLGKQRTLRSVPRKLPLWLRMNLRVTKPLYTCYSQSAMHWLRFRPRVPRRLSLFINVEEQVAAPFTDLYRTLPCRKRCGQIEMIVDLQLLLWLHFLTSHALKRHTSTGVITYWTVFETCHVGYTWGQYNYQYYWDYLILVHHHCTIYRNCVAAITVCTKLSYTKDYRKESESNPVRTSSWIHIDWI